MSLKSRIASYFLILTCAVSSSSQAQTPPAQDLVSDNVGAVSGQFEVNENGAATYSIPIYTPPGRAGVAPEVGLTYNSQGGYGPLGMGWAISGQSSITRCRQTREHGDFVDTNGAPNDGDPQAIAYGGSDRYCLDGQRLLLVNATCPKQGSTATYKDGDDEAEYRLENDPWTRIRSWGGGSCGSGLGNPGRWTVERRDGTVAEYGNTVDSRLSANFVGSARTDQPGAIWALNRSTDSNGNYISYEYLKDPEGAGELVLSRILWTGYDGQVGTPIDPFANITFTYVTRPSEQWVEGFIAGHRTIASQELVRIDVNNTNDNGALSLVRSYLIRYDTSGFTPGTQVLAPKRRLVEVRECADSNGNLCYGRTRKSLIKFPQVWSDRSNSRWVASWTS